MLKTFNTTDLAKSCHAFMRETGNDVIGIRFYKKYGDADYRVFTSVWVGPEHFYKNGRFLMSYRKLLENALMCAPYFECYILPEKCVKRK